MDSRICAFILQVISEIKPGIIAGYQAVSGEPDISPALLELHQLGHAICLPVIHKQVEGEMEFRHWSPESLMHKNRFGIPEPTESGQVALSEIGLVLTPLLGYSAEGHRIGMGGGYYDRIFVSPGVNDPMFRGGDSMIRCGVAYSSQETPLGAPDSWDIALHGVINELGWFTFKR